MDELGRDKVVIDASGHPEEVFVDDKKYHLLCEYDSRLAAGLASVYLQDEGTDVVVAFPRAGLAFVGKFSVELDKLGDLFHYIEATLSLKAKDGFDVYGEDLKDLLVVAEGAGRKFPIIHHGIEPTQSWFAKTYIRVYQDRLLSKQGWFDSERLFWADFDVSRGREGLELPDAPTTEEIPDCATGRELSCLGQYDVRSIMGQVADNAWYGKEPTTVCLAAGENLITIDGYTYEPSYESFSSTASISLNGEVLYGQDSRCVEAYRYEVYPTGRFGSLEEAVAHIADTVKGHAVVLVEETSPVEEKLANARERAMDGIVSGKEDAREHIL